MDESSVEFYTPTNSLLTVEIHPISGQYVVYKRFPTANSEAFAEYYLHNTAAQMCPGVLQVLESRIAFGQVELVLECCGRGSIADILKRKVDTGESPFSNDELEAMIRSMLTTLGEVHSLHIAMRNIDCSNWLVKDDGSVKLSDFGSAILIEQSKSYDPHSQRNLLENIPADTGAARSIYAEDLWALGKVCLEMMCMRRFHSLNILSAQELKDFVSEKAQERECSIGIGYTVKKMLTDEEPHVGELLMSLTPEETLQNDSMKPIDVRDSIVADPAVKISAEVPVGNPRPCDICQVIVDIEKQCLACSHCLCVKCLHGVITAEKQIKCPTCQHVTTAGALRALPNLEEKTKLYLIKMLNKYL